MICFGVTNAIAALGAGSIMKLTGRRPLMAFAFCVHMGVLIFLLHWKPMPEQNFIFFLISGLWGLCDAMWLVQINGKNCDENYNINYYYINSNKLKFEF